MDKINWTRRASGKSSEDNFLPRQMKKEKKNLDSKMEFDDLCGQNCAWQLLKKDTSPNIFVLSENDKSPVIMPHNFDNPIHWKHEK